MAHHRTLPPALIRLHNAVYHGFQKTHPQTIICLAVIQSAEKKHQNTSDRTQHFAEKEPAQGFTSLWCFSVLVRNRLSDQNLNPNLRISANCEAHIPDRSCPFGSRLALERLRQAPAYIRPRRAYRLTKHVSHSYNFRSAIIVLQP